MYPTSSAREGGQAPCPVVEPAQLNGGALLAFLSIKPIANHFFPFRSLALIGRESHTGAASTAASPAPQPWQILF